MNSIKFTILIIFKKNNPLGTAGIIKKIKKPHKDFFIINCDSLININANNLLNFHKDNKNILTFSCFN